MDGAIAGTDFVVAGFATAGADMAGACLAVSCGAGGRITVAGIGALGGMETAVAGAGLAVGCGAGVAGSGILAVDNMGAGVEGTGFAGARGAGAGGTGTDFSGTACTVMACAGADCATGVSPLSFKAQPEAGARISMKPQVENSRLVIIFKKVSMQHISIVKIRFSSSKAFCADNGCVRPIFFSSYAVFEVRVPFLQIWQTCYFAVVKFAGEN